CLHTDHSFRLLGRPPSSPLFPYTTLFRSLLAAEHHLQAGLALVLGLGELHRRGEGVAVQIARLQFVARRRRIALGQRLEQLLERSEEHTSELQSRENLVCRLLLEKKKNTI